MRDLNQISRGDRLLPLLLLRQSELSRSSDLIKMRLSPPAGGARIPASTRLVSSVFRTPLRCGLPKVRHSPTEEDSVLASVMPLRYGNALLATLACPLHCSDPPGNSSRWRLSLAAVAGPVPRRLLTSRRPSSLPSVRSRPTASRAVARHSPRLASAATGRVAPVLDLHVEGWGLTPGPSTTRPTLRRSRAAW